MLSLVSSWWLQGLTEAGLLLLSVAVYSSMEQVWACPLKVSCRGWEGPGQQSSGDNNKELVGKGLKTQTSSRVHGPAMK